MKIVKGKIVEATEAELLDAYLKCEWDTIMSFAEYKRRVQENGTKVLRNRR